jgi:primosomal protein N' (replication factor Y)
MPLLRTKSFKTETCPKCHSENLNERGVGVEQIHEEVLNYFLIMK